MRTVQWLWASLVATGIMPPATAVDDALQPSRPWLVDYEPSTCSAERTYGNEADPVILGLVPSAWGDTFELMVVTKGQGPSSAEELEGSVDFGLGPIKAWLLHYGTDKPTKLSFYRFRISADQIAQAKSALTATFHISGRPDFKFTLASIPDLLNTLHECTADLQHYWNMTAAEQKKIVAPAIGDVRSAFSASDYPDEAMSREQGGKVQFLLLIDEQGKVASCDVMSPSGIPALDAMGCQVIRQRAKFRPALGGDGRPIRSAVVTPPVIWTMD